MLQPRICLRSLPTWSQAFRPTPLVRSYATTDSSNISEATATFEAPPSLKDDAVSSQMFKPKPRTPGLRHRVVAVNDHLWKGRPLLKLTFPRKGQAIGGRNRTGKVTMRHRGGGHKRRIRIVDFARWEAGLQVVERIEHDPGRSAHIALVSHKETGVKAFTASCLVDTLKLCAPEAPFTPKQLKVSRHDSTRAAVSHFFLTFLPGHIYPLCQSHSSCFVGPHQRLQCAT